MDRYRGMFFPIHAMGMMLMPLCLFDAESPQPTEEGPVQEPEDRLVRGDPEPGDHQDGAVNNA
ncbi:hypothetical protein ACFL6R_05510 [Gemmatimonadota bacterium]